MPEEKPVQAGPARKPQRMLYEVCDACAHVPVAHGCKLLRVVETGATAGQLEYLVKLDMLRQEAGISAAMLRDGRAKAMFSNLQDEGARAQRIAAYVLMGYWTCLLKNDLPVPASMNAHLTVAQQIAETGTTDLGPVAITEMIAFVKRIEEEAHHKEKAKHV